MERSELEAKAIDDVVMGCVSQGGEQAMQVGRNAVLASKHLGEGVPRGHHRSPVRFFAAGDPVRRAGRHERNAGRGHRRGVESMSRVPMGSTAMFHMKEGLGNYKSPGLEEKYPGIQWSQFMGAEMIAQKHGFSKDDLDRFALASHQKAIKATKSVCLRGRNRRRRDRNRRRVPSVTRSTRASASTPRWKASPASSCSAPKARSPPPAAARSATDRARCWWSASRR